MMLKVSTSPSLSPLSRQKDVQPCTSLLLDLLNILPLTFHDLVPPSAVEVLIVITQALVNPIALEKLYVNSCNAINDYKLDNCVFKLRCLDPILWSWKEAGK
jgi:hypothetical protein